MSWTQAEAIFNRIYPSWDARTQAMTPQERQAQIARIQSGDLSPQEAGPFIDRPMPPRSPLLAPPAARSEGLPPPDLTARPDTARNLTGARQTINRDQYEFLRDKKGMSDAAIRNQYNLGF